jgi:hypothetical protein
MEHLKYIDGNLDLSSERCNSSQALSFCGGRRRRGPTTRFAEVVLYGEYYDTEFTNSINGLQR